MRSKLAERMREEMKRPERVEQSKRLGVIGATVWDKKTPAEREVIRLRIQRRWREKVGAKQKASEGKS